MGAPSPDFGLLHTLESVGPHGTPWVARYFQDPKDE